MEQDLVEMKRLYDHYVSIGRTENANELKGRLGIGDEPEEKPEKSKKSK